MKNSLIKGARRGWPWDHPRLTAKTICSFIILASSWAWSGGDAAEPARKKSVAVPAELLAVIERYKKAEGITSKIQKNVHLALLGQNKKSEGQFYFSKDKMRIELKGDENSLVVLGAQGLWVELPAVTQGSRVQVTHFTAGALKNNKGSPLALLFGKKDFFKEIRILSSKNNIFVLEPINKADWPEMQKLIVSADLEKNILNSIEWHDELDNKTEFIFKNKEFNKKIDDKVFSYKVPAKAEINTF